MLPPACAQQQTGETMPEYASRLLRFVLASDTTAMLTDSQLELAETAACRALASLPSKLTESDGVMAHRLSETRHRIAQSLKWRRQQLISISPQQPESESAEPDEESDAERAAKLLRAALILLMQPGSDNGGGRPARLIKPVPVRPPGGIALSSPNGQKPDIAF